MRRLFEHLVPRDQTILLVLLGGALLFWTVSTAKRGKLGYRGHADLVETIETHDSVISRKALILTQISNLQEARGRSSATKGKLGSVSQKLARQVHSQAEYKESPSTKTDFFSLHKVRIFFKRASYEQINDYVVRIHALKPEVFLSEIAIKPNYKGKTSPENFDNTYDGTFYVSAVELKKSLSLPDAVPETVP